MIFLRNESFIYVERKLVAMDTKSWLFFSLIMGKVKALLTNFSHVFHAECRMGCVKIRLILELLCMYCISPIPLNRRLMSILVLVLLYFTMMNN